MKPFQHSSPLSLHNCWCLILTLVLFNNNPQATGVTCGDEIPHSFESFKLQKGEFKGVTFITYKLNEKKTQIVIDKIGEVGQTYDDLVATLPEDDCRYAAVDIKFSTSDGRETSKLVFLTWVPDTAKIRAKMLYAGSKKVLQSELNGIGIQINANDFSDLDFESVIKPEVSKYA